MAKSTKPKLPATTPATGIEAEFNALLARAGHVVPKERRPALLAAYVDMKRQVALVKNETLGAEVEPTNVFSLLPYTREG
jgi:hypothetical protein